MKMKKSDSSALPRISIVTPVYNNALYIENCIKSVLNQDYLHLEYIIIDGGSTDGTVEIIEKYTDHLAYFVSEKDRGQTHALNKLVFSKKSAIPF
jgi:glycosyltransferase involved in cell wall biosynthesis